MSKHDHKSKIKLESEQLNYIKMAMDPYKDPV